MRRCVETGGSGRDPVTVGHIPHLYLAPPWPEPTGDAILPLPDATRHHLGRVLRRSSGEITYTDGAGIIGRGRLETGAVVRGEERPAPPPPLRLTLAVAPPQRTERTRFLVEKLAELGVGRLRWISTAFTVGRPPPAAKATGWAVSALEQSRGAHLLDVSGTIDPLASVLSSETVYADAGGGAVKDHWLDDGAGVPGEELTLAVGPEGGFSVEEVPADARRLGLGDRILRTETAAVVGAALIFDTVRRAP